MSSSGRDTIRAAALLLGLVIVPACGESIVAGLEALARAVGL
ncbi:MAG: hypothetical protein ABJA82_09745 [Myxococcales bacterium]